VKDARLNEPISTIYHLYNGRRRPGPDALIRHPHWTRELLDRLGSPDDAFPVIMVTGSKGKGSTAYYLACILEAHGLSVGFFSSPHLLDNLERIRLNRRAISVLEFLDAYHEVKPALDQVLAAMPSTEYLGPVGAFAALACWHFRAKGVDVAVFETGRGARFDDVAEVHHEGAVITRILLEHKRELGPTKREIAWHKAGVVKPETRWLVAPRDPYLLPWLTQTTVEWHPDREMPVSQVQLTGSGLSFRVTADGRVYPAMVPALPRFAADNARHALLAAKRWLNQAFNMDTALGALRGARFPGRGDLLPTTPPVLLDGTVRRESADAVVAAVRAVGWDTGSVVSLIGVPADKDWVGVARTVERLGPLIFVPAKNPRLHFPPTPLARFPTARAVSTLAEAWAEVDAAHPALVLALGTQSFVADVLEFFRLGDALLDLGSLSAPELPTPAAAPLG